MNVKNNTVRIVCLCHVGLSFTVKFYKQGFDVCGVEKSFERIRLLQNKQTYVGDVSTTVSKDSSCILRARDLYAISKEIARKLQSREHDWIVNLAKLVGVKQLFDESNSLFPERYPKKSCAVI